MYYRLVFLWSGNSRSPGGLQGSIHHFCSVWPPTRLRKSPGNKCDLHAGHRWCSLLPRLSPQKWGKGESLGMRLQMIHCHQNQNRNSKKCSNRTWWVWPHYSSCFLLWAAWLVLHSHALRQFQESWGKPPGSLSLAVNVAFSNTSCGMHKVLSTIDPAQSNGNSIGIELQTDDGVHMGT